MWDVRGGGAYLGGGLGESLFFQQFLAGEGHIGEEPYFFSKAGNQNHF